MHIQSIVRHLRTHLSRIDADLRALEQAKPEYRSDISEIVIQSILHDVEYSISELSLVMSDMTPRLRDLFAEECEERRD